MPYIILVIGLLIGLIALYKFFIRANVKQIKALFLTALFIVVCLALFYMAITGRLPAAIALAVAVAPIAASFYQGRKHKQQNSQSGQASSASKSPMTREEALEILGLEEGAEIQAIKDAYKKLMKKVHPDQEGSEWMAAKLNEAKEILLKE